MIIDALQYNNWSEKIFNQLREGGVTAVHVTITYHEDFRETVENIIAWNRRFEQFPDLIRPAGSAEEVQAAARENRTAIIFGCQNCSPIEDDIGLVEILHGLGIRFMQLSYNNQSLLATGCYENEDPGITRMGKQVIGEMNRVGMVVDMSHSDEDPSPLPMPTLRFGILHYEINRNGSLKNFPKTGECSDSRCILTISKTNRNAPWKVSVK